MYLLTLSFLSFLLLVLSFPGDLSPCIHLKGTCLPSLYLPSHLSAILVEIACNSLSCRKYRHEEAYPCRFLVIKFLKIHLKVPYLLREGWIFSGAKGRYFFFHESLTKPYAKSLHCKGLRINNYIVLTTITFYIIGHLREIYYDPAPLLVQVLYMKLLECNACGMEITKLAFILFTGLSQTFHFL